MIKHAGMFAMAAALLVAALVLAGCPQSTDTQGDAVKAATPPATAAAGGAQAELASVTYAVEGMTCDHCVEGITKSVSAVPGVMQCKVDLTGNCATVDYDPLQVTDKMIIDRINGLGYSASIKEAGANLGALAGESGCACGADGGSGECSGECGDPAKTGASAGGEGESCGAGGCGSCEGGTAAATAPAEAPAGCVRAVIYVDGLGCPNKAAKLAQSINALAGVSGAYVDCAVGMVTVDYQKGTADPATFEKAITDFGLKVLDAPPANASDGQAAQA